MSIPPSSAPDNPARREGEGLTSFQVELIKLFFSLPASKGFLLAGGSGLVAQELSRRPTEDIDLFTGPGRGSITAARDELIEGATERQIEVEILRDEPTFCRLLFTRSAEKSLLDFAVDSTPWQPESLTSLGPTFAAIELAGQKTIALFNRAYARDFVDVYNLSSKFDKKDLLLWAAEVDAGFNIPVFREMLMYLSRFKSRELPLPDDEIVRMRSFFARWIDELGVQDNG